MEFSYKGCKIEELQNKTYFSMVHIKDSSVLLFVLVMLFSSCSGQSQESTHSSVKPIYGEWEYVKHYGWRATRYNLEEVEKLKSSIFHIEQDKMFYENIDFIESCSGLTWKISKYDFDLPVLQLEVRYTKEILQDILLIEAVNKQGEPACFNNCASLFLKQDTLINICGGWTFFMVKKSVYKDEFTGRGKEEKEIELTGEETSLELSNEFFKEADEISVENQSGKELFNSGMIETENKQTVKIPLSEVKKVVFKIKSSKPESRWKYSVDIK